MQKLQIYFQAKRTHPEFWDSVTLSLYDFDASAGTYKRKIVCEVFGETFKQKTVCNNLSEIVKKVDSLDLSQFHANKIITGEPYFYVKYDDTDITTSSETDIHTILEMFDFEEARRFFTEKYQEMSASFQ